MLRQRIQSVQHHVRQFIRSYYDVELDELIVEIPPQIEFGDLALPFAFTLAKILRRAPRQIAEEVMTHLPEIPGVTRFEAAGAGYLNVFFDRASFFAELHEWLQNPIECVETEKVIVEHTNINPNKAAHIGHLRNAILGDTFVRILRTLGQNVEVQNYIDNTGVQVADVVVGFRHLRNLSLEQVRELPEPFDYYCWDLYAEVSEWFQQDNSRLRYRDETLAALENGQGEVAVLADYVATRIVRAHLRTMHRIGVSYDLLPRESEILHLKFWEEAFQSLQKKNAIEFRSEGPNAGCWVMRLPTEGDQAEEEKIIVRSNKTVTYVGKDIAYQLWKFGLLGKTFHYQIFTENGDDNTIWVTSTESSDGEPSFGNARHVYNVIDVRQSYLQRVVTQGLRQLGYAREAERSIHFSYEMVALSPRCCDELGIELSTQDQARSYVEVSGRKGLGVKADELIDKLVQESLAEVNLRQDHLDDETRLQIARQIAVGALRYFMLKYTRNSVIAFDFAEALSFEGETGPYLQYSVVRSSNIFRRLRDKTPDWTEERWNEIRSVAFTESTTQREVLADNRIWELLLQVARFEEVLRQAVDTLEIAIVAKYAFALARQFNLFYHRYHILSEKDPVKRSLYLTVAATTRTGLLKLTDVLGIPVPDRM